LLSPAESNVAPIAKPAFAVVDADPDDSKSGKVAPAAGTRVPVRREVWPWVAGIVLAVLCVEWLVYHRRLA
jgi:hypothetical protein